MGILEKQLLYKSNHVLVEVKSLKILQTTDSIFIINHKQTKNSRTV